MLHNIYNLIKRAFVTKTNSDDKQFSLAQVSMMGKTVDIETIYPYGLNAQAPQNSLAILFPIEGQEENLVGICYSSNRPQKLKAGEVQLGNLVAQTFIKFDADGNITITSMKTITVNAQEVQVNSPLTSLGKGGQNIARLGDEITVNVMGTDYIGTITSAGQNTSI